MHEKGVSFFFPLPVFLGAAFSWNQPIVGSTKSATNRRGPFLRPSARLFSHRQVAFEGCISFPKRLEGS